jgi:hypothetical protein
MYLFGDSFQCRNLENVVHDYHNSKLVHELVDGNNLTLSYIKGTSRYDDELNADLEFFKTNQIMPYRWISKITSPGKNNPMFKDNICYYLKTRARVNNLCDAHFGKGKESVEINEKIYRIDMPLIAYAAIKYKGIANSARLWIKDIIRNEANEPSLIVGRSEKSAPEPWIQLTARDLEIGLFEMGYCGTVLKHEGATIRKNICIYDCNLMSHNQFYTAASRVTRSEHLHFA